MHEYGATRFRVPDSEGDEKLAKVWLQDMGYSPEEADEAWREMRKRVNPKPRYASGIHFFDRHPIEHSAPAEDVGVAA